jgi:hypothetical protein
VIFYGAPGCGAEARPACSGSALDTCGALRYYCGCDGRTTIEGGCVSSPMPFLYEGMCRGPDGGSDARD